MSWLRGIELLVGHLGLGPELVGRHAQDQIDGLLGGGLALGHERLAGRLDGRVTVGGGSLAGLLGRGPLGLDLGPARTHRGHHQAQTDGQDHDQAHEQNHQHGEDSHVNDHRHRV